MIFAHAIRSEEDIAKLVEMAGVPVTVNMGFGIRSRPTTPLIPIPRLKEIGVRRISLPRMAAGGRHQRHAAGPATDARRGRVR